MVTSNGNYLWSSLDGGVTYAPPIVTKASAIDALRESLEPDVKETPKRARALTDKALLPIVEQLEAEIAGLRTFAHDAHRASVDSSSYRLQPDGSYAHGSALKYIRDLETKVAALERGIDSLRRGVYFSAFMIGALVPAIIALALWKQPL